MNDKIQRPWWQDAAIYEIYVRSFQDGDGDGVGDLKGILHRVPYLADLKVDAVWLTPFVRSPMADFGYDVADYCEVDPLFGDLADFDRLLAALAEVQIRTIVDFVPNHTSDQHAWFRDSRSSRNSPKRDWYIWRDPAPGGGPPNNWLCMPGGPAWTLDPGTGQFYMHSFLPQQPDLNWRNPAVKAAMLDVLHFWLRRGVHGFRVDVLDRLLKDEQFRDDPPNPRYGPGDPAYMQLSTTRSAGQPGVLDIVGDMRAVLASYPGDRVLIGEIYQPVETLVAFYGDTGRGVQLPFNFNLMWLAWTPQAVMDLVEKYEAALPSGAWPTWVLGNHDQTRIATRLGEAQARVAMMLLLTLRGTPTIYQGDELGLVNTSIAADQVQDPFAKAGPGQGRDPERTPMPWDDTPHSGFSAVEPWLPIGAENARLSVARQHAEPDSQLSLTRALLDLRRREPALSGGSWRGLHADAGVIVYERARGNRRIVVALNMRSTATDLSLDALGAEILVSTHGLSSPRRIGHRLALQANEGVVMLNE